MYVYYYNIKRNVSNRRIEEYVVTNNCRYHLQLFFLAHFMSNYSFQLIVGLLHKLQMALQVYLVRVTL